jgi:hypothetical protein
MGVEVAANLQLSVSVPLLNIRSGNLAPVNAGQSKDLFSTPKKLIIKIPHFCFIITTEEVFEIVIKKLLSARVSIM